MVLATQRPFLPGAPLWDHVNRVFSDVFGSVAPFEAFPAARSAPINVSRDGDGWIVEVLLPGVAQGDVEVTVEGRRLKVRALRRAAGQEGAASDATLQRELDLPEDVAGDGVQATLENGMLTVRLPRSEAARPRRIEVQSRPRELARG